ncbi:MAG: lipid-binding SYLF domain-containing protein [Alphaproteobacteria bacterium]
MLTTHLARTVKSGIAALALGTALAAPAFAFERDAALDRASQATLARCQHRFTSCARTTQDAVGILVFPEVVKADLIFGGSGGRGELIENGQVTGYYSIGAASAGLQIGIDKASQVYVFHNPHSLAELKSGQDWKVGAAGDVTVIKDNTEARTTSAGDVLAYVFNSKGLDAGVSLDVFDVWKTGSARPHSD